MPKFVLIDPSIQGYEGHYYEYALRVVRAASAQGYEGAIAANRRFQVPGAAHPGVYPTYRYAFWFTSTEGGWRRRIKDAARTVRGWMFRPLVRLLFSRWGLWWSLRGDLKEFASRHSLKARSDIALVLPLVLAWLFRLAQASLVLVGHAIPCRGYLAGLGRQALHLARTAFQPLRVVLDPQRPLVYWMWSRIKMKQFARDTRRLFAKVHLAEGDVVFLSLASAVEVMALVRYFRADPRSRLATWHVLFRHQLYGVESGGPTSEANRPIRNALYQLRRALGSHRVRCHTDTEDLSAQYNSLGILDFGTLPIPISEDYQAAWAGMLAGTTGGSVGSRSLCQATAPLRIAYVGDARREKGYQYLPRIVDDLWPKYVATGRCEFVIQSNFNVPEGSPDVVIARAQLAGRACDRVNLLTEPLEPAAYRDLVVGADIILLPYDATIYYAGSSGILAEALAAGVPVIVPEGIWMGRQFEAETQRHLEALKRDLRLVRSEAAEQVRWRCAGQPRTNPISAGALQLGAGALGPYATLGVPDGAEFLLVSAGRTHVHCPAPVQLYLDEMDAARDSLRRRALSVWPAVDAERSVLVSLDPAARLAYLQFSRNSAQAARELANLRFEFLARRYTGQPCPSGTVGLVYREPAEISGLLEEMIENYSHYRDTAVEFSKHWFARHNADRLVEAIRRAA